MACAACTAVGLQRGCTDYVAADLDSLVRSGELGRLATEHGPALAAGLAALLTVKLQVIAVRIAAQLQASSRIIRSDACSPCVFRSVSVRPKCAFIRNCALARRIDRK